MNLSQLIGLPSGAEVIAIAPGSACGYQISAGAIARVIIRGTEENERRVCFQFTKAVCIEASYLNLGKWEQIIRCGACSRSFPANALQTCSECERPEFCAACLQGHLCVTPKDGISRHPRKQSVIVQLHQKERI